jgi:hypothetical protein
MLGMTTRHLTLWSAVLNLVGAFLVFLSFQATSSEFGMTILKNGERALCSHDDALISWGQYSVSMGTHNGCSPEKVQAVPRIAVVTVESPVLGYLGWFLLLFGFVLQIFSIDPSPLTNEQIRDLRKAHKILNSQ